jgi:integrase
VNKTPAGTWGYRFWVHGALDKAQGYETKRLAQAAEATRRREVGAHGPHGGEPTPALADWAALWFDRITPHLAPGTLERYRSVFAHHILPYLGALPLDQLTRARIRDRLLECHLTGGLARSSASNVRIALSGCLADAVEVGHLRANPCAGIDRGRRRRGDLRVSQQPREHPRAHPMTLAERDAFLAVAERDHRRPWVAPYMALQAKAGCRPSEALGLRVEDVDWAHGTAHLWQQWVGGALRPLKTYETRTVDLSPALLARLRAYLGARTAGWLFPSATNPLVPPDGNVVLKRFHSLERHAGLSGFRLYDLRHTYASLHLSGALGEPRPPLYVSRQLGHRDLLTTLRVYAHWIPTEDPRRWVEADAGRATSGRIVPLPYHHRSSITRRSD